MEARRGEEATTVVADAVAVPAVRPARFRWVALCLVAGFGLSILTAELCLGWIDRAHRIARSGKIAQVKDPRFGMRPEPGSGGLDANGFRNASVPERAEIVAIGDSQTWGNNAADDETWPSRLSMLTGASVYSMAWGGCGMVQYWRLATDALRLHPRRVIIGFSLGSNLYTTYSEAYGTPTGAELRRSDSRQELLVDDVAPRAVRFYRELTEFHRRKVNSGLGLWLRERSALGRRLDAAHLWPGVQHTADFEIDSAWASAHPDQGSVCDRAPAPTVLTPEYRRLAVDLSNPRIAEGMRLTRDLLLRIRDDLAAVGVRLLVVLIPTKELVYAPCMENGSSLGAAPHDREVTSEQQVKGQLLAFCDREKIACLDVTPALGEAIRAGRPPYPESTEGHPSADGYAVIAEQIARRLAVAGG